MRVARRVDPHTLPWVLAYVRPRSAPTRTRTHLGHAHIKRRTRTHTKHTTKREMASSLEEWVALIVNAASPIAPPAAREAAMALQNQVRMEERRSGLREAGNWGRAPARRLAVDAVSVFSLFHHLHATQGAVRAGRLGIARRGWPSAPLHAHAGVTARSVRGSPRGHSRPPGPTRNSRSTTLSLHPPPPPCSSRPATPARPPPSAPPWPRPAAP